MEVSKRESREVSMLEFGKILEEDRKKVGSKEVTQREKEYLQHLQSAKYEDFSSMNTEDILVEFGVDSNGTHIVGLFGLNLPDERTEQFFLYFIKTMDRIVEKNYALIYFNSGNGLRMSQVNFLRDLFYTLPEKYLHKLVAFYVVHPSFLLKIYMFFSTTFASGTNLLSKAQYIQGDIRKFTVLNGCRNWEDHIPKNVQPHFVKEYEAKEGASETKIQVQKKIFGLNLEDYPLDEAGIPRVMLILASYFERYPERLRTEYIFRIPGGASEEKEIEGALIREDYEKVLSVNDPNVIAGSFKRLFREMTDPLLLSSNYEKVKTFPRLSEEEKEAFLNDVVASLPELNRNVFMFVLEFFGKVLESAPFNKMEAYSISVVFAPNILRPKTYDASDMLNAKNAIAFFEYALKQRLKVMPPVSEHMASASLAERVRIMSLSQAIPRSMSETIQNEPNSPMPPVEKGTE
eukprot:TRINITY_DN1129_c0_g3_i3.p1 TRINITY_DN1129_c0_g3~~TRINITY_DN1129_c0_g3_i3.p1  ORF type:complete len:462 (-),score=113.25 TRINITY_DN1129_c0_g3_i3:30-1415(-)